MALADLYWDKIDFSKYLNKPGCKECGYASCHDFISDLKGGKKQPSQCPFLSKSEARAFEIALSIKDLWPEVPLLTHPRPASVGLVELGGSHPDPLVLVSGNNEHTQQVLMTLLGTTTGPLNALFADTDGNTVDMAMVYGTLTAERIQKALSDAGIHEKTGKRELLIPGFASPLKEDIENLTRWHVKVGPLCAAELPLFLSRIWI